MTKALIFDIDGTLYDHTHHDFPSGMFEQFRRLKKAGYLIGLATSRSQAELAHLPGEFRQFPFDFKIIDGGARILDHKDMDLIQISLSLQEMEEIEKIVRSKNLQYRYTTEKGDFFIKKPSKSERAIMNYFYLCSPGIKPWQQETVFNVMIWSGPDPDIEQLGEIMSVTPYTGAYEIRHAKSTKGEAVGILRKIGLFDEAIAFGDGENDVEFFEEADFSVCPENGSKAAVKRADRIIPPLKEGGIVSFLKELQ